MNTTTTKTHSPALEAGIWYTICNLITNGLYFITTPLFTRMLSKEAYGITSTYSSWFNILTVMATLDLCSCIQLSKVNYEEKSKEFLSSIWFLSNISVCVFYILYRICYFIQPTYLGLPNELVDILFIEILSRNAYTLLLTQHRSFFRYKEFVSITLVCSVVGQFLSIFLITSAPLPPYLGKILGTALPYFIVSIIISFRIFYQGKTLFNKEYWSYGLKISVPLIPHHLSSNILTQFDRIIITLCIGANTAALYSLANNYTTFVQLIWLSMNGAWTPWFYERMKQRDYESITYFVKPYTVLFALFTIIATSIGPEIIFILGGTDYKDSILVIPPIILGIYFQFLYSLYVNIEFYYKKTAKIALSTFLSAVCNIILNFIFIPILGYTAAAYTTLFSFILLLILHYYAAKQLEHKDLFDKKFLCMITFFTTLFIFMFYFLYSLTLLRYILLSIFCLACIIYTSKNRKQLLPPT